MDKLETLEELIAGRHEHHTALRLGEMGRGCQAAQVDSLVQGRFVRSAAIVGGSERGGGHGGGQR